LELLGVDQDAGSHDFGDPGQGGARRASLRPARAVAGVLEEAALALRTGVPLYLAGGFGGCAQVMAAAVGGSTQTELTLDYQLRHTPRYGELFDAALSADVAPSFDELVGSLVEAGVEGLRNGLDAADNGRLFVTDDVDEVVALVLRGLRQVTDVA